MNTWNKIKVIVKWLFTIYLQLLFIGTPPFEKLTEVLTKKSQLKDIKQMSGEHATSSLEAFHSVQNHFVTKRLAFSYHGMTSR